MVRLSRWIYDRKLDTSKYKILDALHSILGQDIVMGLNQISRVAGISKVTALRHLPGLVEKGFVKITIVGSYPKYSITPDGIARKNAIQHQSLTISFASSSETQFFRIEPGEITRDSSASVVWQGSLSEQEQSEIKEAYTDFVKKVEKIVVDKDISIRAIATLKQKEENRKTYTH